MGFREVGLSESEYKRIQELLGREPNDLELELIGVMWSEHCSYKSTRPLLRTFPSKGKYVLQGQGENAGVVDMGEGWGFAFKVESHNHPLRGRAPSREPRRESAASSATSSQWARAPRRGGCGSRP